MSDNVWQKAIISKNSTLEDAIKNLNEVAVKIVMVTGADGELLGTISDGDIRRGLLKGLTLQSLVDEVLHRNAIVAPPNLEKDAIKHLMVANKIQQIPVVNERRNVVGLYLWDQIDSLKDRKNLMVIMAGGMGKRLLPHTENCPKPLLRVGGKPMLEHIIKRATEEGFTEFILSINYLGHMIEDYFGDGGRLDVSIKYLRESNPLGTAGALSLLRIRPELPIVVTNGDVMTDIKYGEVVDFHMSNQALATMAVRPHEWQHPFGVVQISGLDITGFDEKPVVRTHINAGVYVLNPEVLDYMPSEQRCDMPILFDLIKAKGGRTMAYPMHEPWLDVGRPADLVEAQSHKY
jgi:dTDP-glucose pyrophosphorylase/predicted transcriptional regulator